MSSFDENKTVVDTELEAFKAKAMSKCTTYRKHVLAEKGKQSTMRQEISQALGGSSSSDDVSASIAKYKLEHEIFSSSGSSAETCAADQVPNNVATAILSDPSAPT